MIIENISNRPGKRVHVVQGEHYVTDDPDITLTTILGSCVAVCLWDPQRGVGGMNHFLLPEGKAEGANEGRRYGAFAMELLINELLRMGARRENMQAKLFGGARMFSGLSDVGASNAAFAERFLRDEGIPVVGTSLGGFGARRIQFWPVSGRAQQKTVTDTNELKEVAKPRAPAPLPVAEGAVELF
ncbi:MAG: chemotaxis protein CheD [Phenylobacterium sp.]|uniref:chemotaxis protein CheD n=1 Tax=Phenylobacterium sp. TaxID=1871053 RepID=UPI0027279440|nr:chemotaxis protein CheD [Phenylobacterium sp.]MDO8409616.1 chemotaxis protein CheD [Phenylobacterium sp.]